MRALHRRGRDPAPARGPGGPATKIQLPDGFGFASYEPVPGWRVKVQRAKLPEPVKTDDGEISEGVKEIIWTSKTGIPAGAFQDFGLSVQMPGKAGDALTFKAVQTYSNGEVVRWIGPEGSDNPAPQGRARPPAATTTTPPRPPAANTDDDGGSSDGPAIAALVVGGLGLLTGGAALVAARRLSPRAG